MLWCQNEIFTLTTHVNRGDFALGQGGWFAVTYSLTQWENTPYIFIVHIEIGQHTITPDDGNAKMDRKVTQADKKHKIAS